MASNLRWGILGLGKIAHTFAQDVSLLKGHALTFVASRDLDKATSFANRYQVKQVGGYTDLLRTDEVDIIYVATPHHAHFEFTIASLKAGKHVLCEKPLAVNSKQVSEMIRVAQEENKFLMEALWTRFNPVINEVKSTIDDGLIGEVNYINADFSFLTVPNPSSRLTNIDLAGGSLLDVGIYPIFLSYFLKGMPDDIQVQARFYSNGADRQCSMLFRYPDALSMMMSGLDSKSDMPAQIIGEKGKIIIHPRWHATEGYTFKDNAGHQKEIRIKKIGNGFTEEIQACAEAIQQGKIEHHMWRHQDSLNLVSLLDSVREKIGLHYPFE